MVSIWYNSSRNVIQINNPQNKRILRKGAGEGYW